MQKIAILKAANKKSSLKRPIWDAIYSRRKNKIHAHGLSNMINVLHVYVITKRTTVSIVLSVIVVKTSRILSNF